MQTCASFDVAATSMPVFRAMSSVSCSYRILKVRLTCGAPLRKSGNHHIAIFASALQIDPKSFDWCCALSRTNIPAGDGIRREAASNSGLSTKAISMIAFPLRIPSYLTKLSKARFSSQYSMVRRQIRKVVTEFIPRPAVLNSVSDLNVHFDCVFNMLQPNPLWTIYRSHVGT